MFFIPLNKPDDEKIVLTKFEQLYGITYQLTYNGMFVNLNLRHIFELFDEGDFQFYDLLPDCYKIFYSDEDRNDLIKIVPYLEGVHLYSENEIYADVRLNQHKFTFATVAFDCQRSVWDELARHRKNGLCCESSRYCQYSKGKFGGEITFSKPAWVENENDEIYKELQDSCKKAEDSYMRLTELGLKAQDARFVLPLGYRVNCVVTASVDQWKHIFALRTSKAAHPDIAAIMKDVEKDFENEGLL